MKHFFTLILLSIIGLYHAHSQTVVYDSVALGANAVNDVYYALPSQTHYPTIGDWDMAVSMQPGGMTDPLKSVTVRINGGRGVEIKKITDTDTSGFYSLTSSANYDYWQMLFDSPINWDIGGLNSTLNTGNMFDFGWGIYDITTHNVTADSIYAIKVLDGTIKKLWIHYLEYDTLWHITVSEFDNSASSTFSVSKNLPGKNFKYLQLNPANVQQFDKEPNDPWDLMFTRYIDFVGIPYPVNGALMNKGVQAVKAYPVNDVNNVSYSNYSSSLSYDINTIGFDWKYYDGANMVYVIEDSLVYFIKAKDNNIYKLRFTDYKSTNAEAVFALEEITTGIESVNENSSLILYPNPVSNTLSVIDFGDASSSRFKVYNVAGQELINGKNNSHQAVSLNVSNLSEGMYFIQLIKNGSVTTRSFVVNR